MVPIKSGFAHWNQQEGLTSKGRTLAQSHETTTVSGREMRWFISVRRSQRFVNAQVAGSRY
jgi:hypothetical protein